jgi:hypothetical protein
MRRHVWVVAAILSIGGSNAGAIPCPAGGAKVKVVINNPTAVTGQQVSISGRVLEGGGTCTGQSDTYAATVTLSSIGDNEFTIPAGGGLNSGLWVHQISAGDQLQHQQSVVLFTTNPSAYATVNWTYFPAVVSVNRAGDPTSTACPPTCTLRQAITRANSLATSDPAVLVQFTLSPGAMFQTGSLVVGSGSTAPITIDGTGTSGAPWIVGDPLAAAMGTQDPFPRAVDLANKTRFYVLGDNVTIKGIEIRNTVPGTGNPVLSLIETDPQADSTLIEAVRLDGGAKQACIDGLLNCADNQVNLLTLWGAASVVNVEGRAAWSNGVWATGAGFHEIRDSWLHHNYARGVLGDFVELARNTVEFSGRQLFTETVRFAGAVGVAGDGISEIYTEQNVIQNNLQNGIRAPYTPLGVALARDIICGNGQVGPFFDDQSGIFLDGGSGSNATAAGTGLGVTYNAEFGLHAGFSLFSGGLPFDHGSAFTANVGCGLLNDSGHAISAVNNQWRGMTTSSCQSSPDVCSVSGAINCDPVADGPNAPIILSGTYPTNAIRKGQTLRVQGSGFNAIAGNPMAGVAGCEIGADDVTTDNCCRDTERANVCIPAAGPTIPPLPPADGSNCVALRNGVNRWKAAPVTGVSPAGLVAQIPSTAIECLGGSNEKVRVVKLDSLGSEISDEIDYCTNP